MNVAFLLSSALCCLIRIECKEIGLQALDLLHPHFFPKPTIYKELTDASSLLGQATIGWEKTFARDMIKGPN